MYIGQLNYSKRLESWQARQVLAHFGTREEYQAQRLHVTVATIRRWIAQGVPKHVITRYENETGRKVE